VNAGVDVGALTEKQIREDNGFLTDSGRFVTSREAESSAAARTFQAAQQKMVPAEPTPQHKQGLEGLLIQQEKLRLRVILEDIEQFMPQNDLMK